MISNPDSALSPSNAFNGQNLQQFYPQEGSASESKLSSYLSVICLGQMKGANTQSFVASNS